MSYTSGEQFEVVGPWGSDSADDADDARRIVDEFHLQYPPTDASRTAYARHREWRNYAKGDEEFVGEWVSIDEPLPTPYGIVTDGWLYARCAGCGDEIKLEVTRNGALWETANYDPRTARATEFRCMERRIPDNHGLFMHSPEF